MKTKMILLSAALLFAGCAKAQTDTGPASSADQAPAQLPTVIHDPAGGPDRVDGIVLVNKNHGVAMDYAPGEDPEAKEALVRLQTAMMDQGLDVSWDYSGFRSYDTQAGLYENYVASYGQEEADRFSARPGYSEHQTGLAFDLKDSSGQLITAPAESQWLMDHAPEYGFIVRYLPGKEDITGYMEEPWHIRYIGQRAADIAASGKTLEEYLGVN